MSSLRTVLGGLEVNKINKEHATLILVHFVHESKEKIMNFFSRHKWALIITGVLATPFLLIACGGGAADTVALVKDTVDIVSPPTTKNAGGITYTTRDLVGVDANGDGVDDAAAKQLQTLLGSDPAVLSAFMTSAKLDRELLSIPDAKLPTTKAEADALINNNANDVAGCVELQVSGVEHVEGYWRKYYYTVFNTVAKRQRLSEIETLAGYTSRTVRGCDEILGTSTPSTK